MSAPRIFTYADAIENLIEFAAARGKGDISQRSMRGAIRAAYIEVPSLCDWPTLTRPGRIHLRALQSTGTVVFDFTGGAYERQLTLADSTWPDWCIDAVVRFDGKISHIESKKSDTVVTLDATMNPGEDVVLATYSLFPQWYILPENFTSLSGPIREDSGYILSSITLTEMLRLYRNQYSTGKPQVYCIAEVPDLYGSLGIYLYPVKTESGTLDYIGTRQPRRLRHTGYDANDYVGTIAVTAGSATVTGTSTAFNNTMLGAILRIGTDTTHRPTGLEGEYPFIEERSIAAVASATSLTLDNNVETTRSGVKYTVASPIDLGVSLHNLFMRQCEKHLARSQMFGEGLLKERALIDSAETEARMLAMGTRMHAQEDDLVGAEWRGPVFDGTSSFE